MTRQKKTEYIFFSAFLVILVFLVWKCRYGYAHIDETFYLTIPLRLCKGDCLIIDEWHPSQLFGFLLYPLMKVYLWITNSTEGIMLNFRYIFTAVWAVNSLFIYFRLKSKSLYGAFFAALFFMLFVPGGIMALNYNTLGIMLLLDACILITTIDTRNPVQKCIAGFLFAGSVLCCPYLVILYFFFTAAAVICKKKVRDILQTWAMVTLGCVFLFAIFCFFVFVMRHASVSDLVKSIPHLFKDPKHLSQSIIQVSIHYLSYIITCCRIFPVCLLVMLAAAAVSKWKKKPAIGFIITISMIVAIQFYFLIRNAYINSFMFPFNLIVPYCVIHSKKREIRNLFWMIWIPGLIYTYCINLASDQCFFAISSASTVMIIASVIIMFEFVKELDLTTSNKTILRIASLSAALLIGMQTGLELFMRYNFIYWEDDGMTAQTVLAESGIEKGILMTPGRYDIYMSDSKDMAIIHNDKRISKLLILSNNTNLYMSADKEFATYSAWLSGVNDYTMQRLGDFYDIRPDKIPDTIYIEKDFSQYNEILTEKGYSSEQMDSGAFLLRK